VKSIADEFKKSSKTHDWIVTPGVGYDLNIPELGAYLSLTRVRHDRNETFGLLTIRITFRGAKTIYGTNILHSADFNCSSHEARKRLGKHLGERANADDVEWGLLLDELCVRILDAEEQGEPERLLHDIPIDREAFLELDAGGLPLLRRHPTIWFGDGGAAKSYLALYASINLVQQGERVLYLDWEFAGEEHRLRMERILGADAKLDNLFYLRCDRPLSREVAKLKGIISRKHVTFVVCDSIGFAADATPESAEAATNYYRAFRELGQLGSLHLAHMVKQSNDKKAPDPDKPFGSVFWSNGARSIWLLKRDPDNKDKRVVPVGFFHKKANTGPLQQDFAMVASFPPGETLIRTDEITNHPGLCGTLKVPARLIAALTENGASMTRDELADALELQTASARDKLKHAITAAKGKNKLFETSDGKIGLVN
jgi:hypothetical protein